MGNHWQVLKREDQLKRARSCPSCSWQRGWQWEVGGGSVHSGAWAWSGLKKGEVENLRVQEDRGWAGCTHSAPAKTGAFVGETRPCRVRLLPPFLLKYVPYGQKGAWQRTGA